MTDRLRGFVGADQRGRYLGLVNENVLGWFRVNCKPEQARHAIELLMIKAAAFDEGDVHFYGYDEGEFWTYAIVVTSRTGA